MLCCCHLKILKYFLNKGFTFSFCAEPQDYVRILYTAVGEAHFCSLKVLHACWVWVDGPKVISSQSYTHPGGASGLRMSTHASMVGENGPEDLFEAAKRTQQRPSLPDSIMATPGRNCSWETRSHNASVQGILLGFIFCKRSKVLNSEIFLKPLENPT